MMKPIEITLENVKQHNKPNDLWIIIEDKVYDVTKFRLEHPGGEDTLDEVAGRDATKDFIEVGHSSEARDIMKKFYVGDLAVSDRNAKSSLPIREIGIAVGAVFIGIATVLLIKKILTSKH